jgi:hypothetical protein
VDRKEKVTAEILKHQKESIEDLEAKYAPSYSSPHTPLVLNPALS